MAGSETSPLRRLLGWEGFLALVLLVTIAVNAGLSDVFLTVPNQINLFQLSIEKIIVALIMTLVIVNGEIDLSVASMMGLAACAFGWLFQAGVPAPLACLIVLGIGAAGGASKSVLESTRLRHVPSPWSPRAGRSLFRPSPGAWRTRPSNRVIRELVRPPAKQR